MVASSSLTLRVTRGLSGEHVCDLKASGDWDVADLKWEISQKLQVPETQQRLIAHRRAVLMSHEVLSKVFPTGGTHDVILICLDVEWAKTLQDVASGHTRLQDVDASQRQDRELVMAAVRRSGAQLEHACKEFRADKEIVMAAVKEQGQSLVFAAETLRGDSEIVLEAVRNDGLAVRHATECARGNPAIGLAAVTQNGWALELLSEKLRSHREIVWMAVKQEGQAIKFVSDDLRNNKELVIVAVKSNAEALRVISTEHRRDLEVVRAASLGVRMRGFGGLNYFKSLLGPVAADSICPNI